MKRATAPAASIATVERDTGLSKDTLRVWERRYGFPQPMRDDNGERVYPAVQLEKLRVIRRLMDSGVRPGQIVAQPLAALNARLQALPQCTLRGAPALPAVAEAVRLLKSQQVVKLRRLLTHALVQLGLQRFVIELVAPLNERVGNAWVDGGIEIFEEHLYAEQIQQLLRQAIGALTQNEQGPRVLLTTLSGEQHKLGLLMAEACLAAEGAHCISLGVETPALDIAQAARAHRVDIVGLSFSTAMPINVARRGLADLRKRLDRKVVLWAGGNLWQRVRKVAPGVTIVASLTEIPEAIRDLRVA